MTSMHVNASGRVGSFSAAAPERQPPHRFIRDAPARGTSQEAL